MSAIEGLTPARLQYIRKGINMGLHITTARRILHAHYKSPKFTTLVHINRITVYSEITNDGDRFFRTYDNANSHTFVQFLTKMHRTFGKILVIADKAASHTSVLVRKFVGENEIGIFSHRNAAAQRDRGGLEQGKEDAGGI